jgi:hypothetical protein
VPDRGPKPSQTMGIAKSVGVLLKVVEFKFRLHTMQPFRRVMGSMVRGVA